MKRHPGLRPFSDDHHQGLVHSLRLRRAAGDPGTLRETARAFLEFWREDTSAHFRREEEILLPVLARYGGDVEREPVTEMLAQHARIRGLVMSLEDELDRGEIRPETAREIGELLESHIRLEERIVFPAIEEELPEEALQEISARLEAPGV